MLVVLVIIIIVTAIALSGQSGFNRTQALHNTAYDIGLTLRQAQSYGLASQLYHSIGNANAPYGLSFSSTNSTGYTFFVDTHPSAPGYGLSGNVCPGHLVSSGPEARPGNCVYDTGDAVIQDYTLNNGFTIPEFCAYSSTGSGNYYPNGTVCSTDGVKISSLNITFARPNAETTIVGSVSGSQYGFTAVCVKLADPQGDSRYVSISKTGQVQVGDRSVDPVDPSDPDVCPS
jgi:type II secretory pathway pseudopilin PulG